LLSVCGFVPVTASECDNPGPDWIACEDFENGGLGWQQWFDQSIFVECNGCSGGANNPDRIRLTDNPADVHDGSWALYMPAEASANYQGASLTFRSCDGEKRSGCTLIGYEELHFRTWLKLAEDHQYVHHFLSISGSRPDNYWETDGNAGCLPNGIRWAGTTVDFNQDHELFFYTYYPEMSCDTRCDRYMDVDQNCQSCAAKEMPTCDAQPQCCWGNHFTPDPAVVLPLGEWVCLEMMMRINDVGQSNGEMAFWLNGRPGHSQTGMHWRDVPELMLNKVWLQHYIAGGDADQSNRIWFDDVVVSTGPVGCGGAPVEPGGLNVPGEPDLSVLSVSESRVHLSIILPHSGTYAVSLYGLEGGRIVHSGIVRGRKGENTLALDVPEGGNRLCIAVLRQDIKKATRIMPVFP
jgi:hypothetical protein